MLVSMPLKSAEVEEENVKKPMVLLDLAPRRAQLDDLVLSRLLSGLLVQFTMIFLEGFWYSV